MAQEKIEHEKMAQKKLSLEIMEQEKIEHEKKVITRNNRWHKK